MSKESDKGNEDIKELEKWVYNSSVHSKARRCGFVLALEFSIF